VLVVISSIVTAVILAVLATLGGIIGVAIFEKRKGDGTAPPPPQNFA
jgi:zinc transporter ZupT